MTDADTGDTTEHMPNPFGEQQELFKLLSQDTRHKIIQMLLGHPAHLASLAELTYMTGKSRGAIRNQLDELQDAGLIEVYRRSENMDSRKFPAKFYGFTAYGVRILDQYEYLSGLPMMRALYDKTKKDKKILHHEEAPRPSLPDVVKNALTFDESGEDTQNDSDDGDTDTPGETVTNASSNR